MFGVAKKMYDWASLKANSRFAPAWLGVVFFLELIFFIPMDALLLLFCLENPNRRYLYALVAGAASIASAFIGYYVGLKAWGVVSPYILDHLISTSFFERIHGYYLNSQHWAVFLGSFLPLPFKAVTLTAGVCELAFFPFICAVGLARWARFFFIAKATERWGLQIKSFVDKYFNRFVYAVGAKIAIALGFLWALS